MIKALNEFKVRNKKNNTIETYKIGSVNGYFNNNKFYEDNAFTTEIEKAEGLTYIDKITNNVYAYISSTFVKIGGKNQAIITVGKTADCNYICDGIADNIEFQKAIDIVSAAGGGIVYVKDGNYTFNTSVHPKSNVELNMSANTIITMDEQQIWTLPEPTTINEKTFTVSDEILDYISVYQMIGLTDGTEGYIYDNGTTRHSDIITAIDYNNKTVTVYRGMPASFTTLVTTDDAFYHSDGILGAQDNITIKGGIIDGNKDNQKVWLHDEGQNGFLIGTAKGNLTIENVTVRNFFFQGIHPMTYSHSRENRAGITTTIRGCYIHHTGFSAICIDSSGLVTVENCVAHDCMCAIQIVDVNKVYINNCCGTDCTTAGIMINGNPYLSPSTDLDNYIRIENCVLVNSINGILLQNTKDSIISNSIITNNQETGVKLQSNCSRISLNGLTLINNGVGISEANDCSDNIANSILFNSNTKDYNISSMKIGDNPSEVNLSRHTDSIIYTKNQNGEVTGGIISDPSLVDTDFILIDTVAMKDTWVVHEGYATAKHLTGLKPNTQYTMWTDGRLPEGSPMGALYFSALDYPVERDGYKTATTDENGEIWMWVTAYDSYPNYPKYFDGTYKVTLAEGTTPQPYINTTPVLYTSKPTVSNKVVCENELTQKVNQKWEETINSGATSGTNIVNLTDIEYANLSLATKMNGSIYMVHFIDDENEEHEVVDLTPRMTSATSDTGTASGTGTDPSYVAWKAFASEDSFDVRNTDGCFEANNNNYLQFDFNRTVTITKLSAASYTPSENTRYSYWKIYIKSADSDDYIYVQDIYIEPTVKPNYVGTRSDIELDSPITNCRSIRFVPADEVDIIGALHIYGYNTSPIEIDLTPRMTSATSDTGVISAAELNDSGYIPWHAMATDDSFNISTYGDNITLNPGGYLQFNFNNSVNITEIKAASKSPYNKFKIMYSQDSNNWEFAQDIEINSNSPESNVYSAQVIKLSETIRNCTSIRLVNNVGDEGNNIANIGALHFYGYYPTESEKKEGTYGMYYKNFKINLSASDLVTKEELNSLQNELNMVEDALDDIILEGTEE